MKTKKTAEELIAEVEAAKDIFRKMEALKIEERRRLREDGKAGTQQFARVCGSDSAWQLAAEELERILEGAAG